MRFLLPWLFAASLFPAFASANPPNIIFILSDDHRYDLMGFHPDAPESVSYTHLTLPTKA